jgi:hypothetical protein
MTHDVQLVLVIYGAVCVAATSAYIIASLLTNAHKLKLARAVTS